MANTSADDSFEVVLKLFGTVSHFERGLVHSYARAIGVDSFAVLYDLGGRSNASNLTESERSSLPKAYRTCFYSFQLARARFSAMERRYAMRTRRWPAGLRRHLFTARNLMVDLPVVLYQLGVLEGCTQRRHHRYVWAVEADAVFAGAVGTFFAALRSDRSDLLSTGFTIAGKKWWGFKLSTFPERLSFQRTSFVGHGLRTLPEPNCNRTAALPPGVLPSTHETEYYTIAVRDDLRYAPGRA